MQQNPSFDFQFERRAQISIGLIRIVSVFAAFWLILGLYLGAPKLSAAAAFAVCGFLISWGLHHRRMYLASGVLWLLVANTAIVIGAHVVHSQGYVSFILVPAAIVPFLIFSWREKPGLIVGFVLLSCALWLISWSTDFNLLGPNEVDAETAHKWAAPLSAATIFGVVFFEIGFYQFLFGRYQDQLQARAADLQVALEAERAT